MILTIESALTRNRGKESNQKITPITPASSEQTDLRAYALNRLAALAKPQPEHSEREECACGVEQRIVSRSRAAGHKGLVKFIQYGISRGDEERADSPH